MTTDSQAKEAMLPIDFNTFILSLSTSALIHLGAVQDPDTPEHMQEVLTEINESQSQPINLPMAKQTIDLIALLEEKTRGNLSGEEERLISQVLQDLRIRFVQASKV